MLLGKVPVNILKRSVTNLIGKSVNAGTDCAITSSPVDMCATGVCTVGSPIAPMVAICKAANNILVSGGCINGIEVAFLLNDKAREIAIKRMTRNALEACSMYDTNLIGGHTEVSDNVACNIVTATALGTHKGRDYSSRNIKGGEDIVITKWIGIEQVALLLSDKSKQAEILEHFCPEYIEPIKSCAEWMHLADEIAALEPELDGNIISMHDMSEGGIFGALWEMCMGADCGLVIDLHKIPIRQEISEIHTFYGIDIYKSRSSGSMILACRDGARVAECLRAAGIPATVIGNFTQDKDKIINSHEEIRYLNEK